MREPDWHAHGYVHLGNPASQPYGNGVLLWFETAEFDAAMERVRALGATILDGPRVNPNAYQRQVWLRDPDGYAVVLAGVQGDLGRSR